MFFQKFLSSLKNNLSGKRNLNLELLDGRVHYSIIKFLSESFVSTLNATFLLRTVVSLKLDLLSDTLPRVPSQSFQTQSRLFNPVSAQFSEYVS